MIDRYTKIVLTIIAVALTALAVQGVVTSAQAQGQDCGDMFNPCYVTNNGLFVVRVDG